MNETILDCLTESALECRGHFDVIIAELAGLHRTIGRLEGKIEILISQVDKQSNHCGGMDLIHISQLEGMLHGLNYQLERLGISRVTHENTEIKSNPTVEEE